MTGPMSDRNGSLRTIFVGGPGRSGTSFVADRLIGHAQICGFRDVELKLFTEKGGLLDLRHSLVECYSPNRAGVALQQFRRLCDALFQGQFGQVALSSLMSKALWAEAVDRFLIGLLRDGHPVRTNAAAFHALGQDFTGQIAEIARSQDRTSADAIAFLEKTPHALLAMDFLRSIAPGSRFIHVMRDPRSIAWSLRKMRWGPDTLQQCCTWVASYCDAWLETASPIVRNSSDLACLRIEEVAHAPGDAASDLCDWLGVSTDRDLFKGADLETLNAWSLRCTDEERDLLNRRLRHWVQFFGYSADKIGIPVAACHDHPAAKPDDLLSEDTAAAAVEVA